MALKRVKYLLVNLMKEMKALCTKNYKILMKENEMIQINGKIFGVHKSEELILLKRLSIQNQI